ncbi:hypothetical protein PHYPSEUDO_006015 [Phytophthora pseudosyringae]|uniref:Uncharacterized protein n=1 Tax=Phytophthora pseudosyringae TaxID=221518 RepID=A0A8T1VJJ9_9STRA|nr:hypothetical protein PHYPSEUDO_006015 [Phytophthora pseudosyringae]
MAPASAAALKRRWGFLSPWCKVLQKRISYVWPLREEEVWAVQRRRLEVYLPTRHDATQSFWADPQPLYSNNQEFQVCFQKVREALALLAAVAHVDSAGWRYLLAEHCDVDLGEEGQQVFEGDIPAEFVLYFLQDEKKYPESLKNDIIRFCGVHQREHASAAYSKALKRVAALDESLKAKKSVIDIEIPVRVCFTVMHPASYMFLCEGSEPLKDIQQAEKLVKQEWENHERSRKKRHVEPRSLRCTFVLEPMIASFNDARITPDLTETMQTLVWENTWFSHVSFWLFMSHELETNEHASRLVIGRLMSSIFGDTRRSSELANSRYRAESDASRGDSLPLQLGLVNLECDSSMSSHSFEAMCSAIVVNQTTSKLSMLLEMDPEEPATSQHWWRWLAYALFSKRTRASSSLESLALLRIGSMSIADIEAFSSVLASDHPEEALFGCTRGAVDEKDATIKAGALIHCKLNNRGQPPRGTRSLTFESAITSVRVFSDDVQSEWLNVLVPGYGRCYVQRTNLEYQETPTVFAGSRGVTDLKIEFDRDDPSISDGLPSFLAAIGPSLKRLTVDPSGIELDAIVRNCPNLEELSLCGGELVDIRLNFSEYHANNQAIPELPFDWDDVVALANALAITDSPLAKCVRRMRVRLIDQWAAWGIIVADHNNRPAFQAGLRALLEMLEVNQSLEYLDVVVPFGHFIYLEDFRQHHLEPINRSLKLSMETKIAFLSVLSTRSKPIEAANKPKRRSTRSAHARRPLSELNQHVVSTIFAFAAPRVLREVYLRDPPDDRWEEPEVVPI